MFVIRVIMVRRVVAEGSVHFWDGALAVAVVSWTMIWLLLSTEKPTRVQLPRDIRHTLNKRNLCSCDVIARRLIAECAHRGGLVCLRQISS